MRKTNLIQVKDASEGGEENKSGTEEDEEDRRINKTRRGDCSPIF
jgi:hypothetical protein